MFVKPLPCATFSRLLLSYVHVQCAVCKEKRFKLAKTKIMAYLIFNMKQDLI